jgi:hypothetical protein
MDCFIVVNAVLDRDQQQAGGGFFGGIENGGNGAVKTLIWDGRQS